MKPTHFLAMRIRDSVILQSLRSTQQLMISGVEADATSAVIKECAYDVSKAHITLCVLQLSNADEVRQAQTILYDLQSVFSELLGGCSFTVAGIDAFWGERVVYAKVQVTESFMSFQKHVKDAFSDLSFPRAVRSPSSSLRSADSHDPVPYQPHVTLFKTSSLSKRNPSVRLPFQQWVLNHSHATFGSERITSLELCAMKSQPDGYFVVESSVSISDAT
eukprot:ANDGO_06736.mRNA.1 hypothetical protein SPRG_16348